MMAIDQSLAVSAPDGGHHAIHTKAITSEQINIKEDRTALINSAAVAGLRSDDRNDNGHRGYFARTGCGPGSAGAHGDPAPAARPQPSCPRGRVQRGLPRTGLRSGLHRYSVWSNVVASSSRPWDLSKRPLLSSNVTLPGPAAGRRLAEARGGDSNGSPSTTAADLSEMSAASGSVGTRRRDTGNDSGSGATFHAFSNRHRQQPVSSRPASLV